MNVQITLSSIYEQFVEAFASFGINLVAVIAALKIVFYLLTIFFALVIVILLFEISANAKKSIAMMADSVAVPGLPKKRLEKQWEAIVQKLESDNPNDYKIAVIEADKILDDLLKRIGYQGEDMGQRLKQITTEQLANIDELWEAHKLRNRIVHQPNFQVKREHAKQAVEIYQRAMQDLEAL